MSDKEKRPELLKGYTAKRKVSCSNSQNLYITVNEPGNIREIFCHIGKQGLCQKGMLQAISREASLAIRSGVPVDTIVAILESGKGCQDGNCINGFLDKITHLAEVAIEAGVSLDEIISTLRDVPTCSSGDEKEQLACWHHLANVLKKYKETK